MARYRWKRYVPVAERRAKAARKVQQLARKGKKIEPVEITGRTIAHSFWGQAWCDHLEQFSDFANRLPRGRTYVRNGSVCHLAIGAGRIEAMVSGSALYDVRIDVKPLPAAKWGRLREQCTGRIGSLLELLQGRFSKEVMAIVTDPDQGLFPHPDEIAMQCSCPDWAYLCKHLAAVLYGVGARLDEQPELLFKLRGVDHQELIGAELDLTRATAGQGRRRRLQGGDLSALFGVQIDEQADTPPQPPTRRPAREPADQQPVAPADGDFVPDADTVIRLRQGFGMARAEFARLLGVSTASVANWEKSDRPLRLQRKTLAALREAAGMTAERATARLKGRRSG